MNLKVHRKQLVFSALAVMLAVSAYWIPDHPLSLSRSVSQASDMESGFAPEEESVLMDGSWSEPFPRHSALI